MAWWGWLILGVWLGSTAGVLVMGVLTGGRAEERRAECDTPPNGDDG